MEVAQTICDLFLILGFFEKGREERIGEQGQILGI